MSKRHERTLARRMAVQALYTSEITKVPLEQLLEEDIELPDEGTLPEYAIHLLEGVASHSDEIDQLLDEASVHWAVERMPLVDYSILRMATYEMIFEQETPVSVCINEAVELAKYYGGQDDSARFANGILGQIARTHDPEHNDVPELTDDCDTHDRDTMIEEGE